MNPRYVWYAKSQGRTPEAQLEHDKAEYHEDASEARASSRTRLTCSARGTRRGQAKCKLPVLHCLRCTACAELPESAVRARKCAT